MESIDGDRHSHFSLGEHHGPWPQIATELGSGVTFSIIHLTSNDPGFTRFMSPCNITKPGGLSLYVPKDDV